MRKFRWRRFRIVYRRVSLRGKAAEYRELKQTALIFVLKKAEEINKVYNFKYNRISVKNQKSRWGSCSKKGNLNFHYKIIRLPERLANYLVAHELCHLKEFNHSRNFWDLVALTCPDYKIRRQEFKRIF